ncbi:hypothetical protein SADUNF_Sadunf08G0125700 [Salix dunnii]|uniref:Uncharacterized protein n=1 Tax=Salix dunnii TaxID=1413687 RepID=A0A835JUE4_9ROSI|nr:hypothetical protein SADUNF_Sadunf08G0125700 [Salix dunnii]
MSESSYITSRICFHVDLSPNNIAVAMVHVVQGVLGLARLADQVTVTFLHISEVHIFVTKGVPVSLFGALSWSSMSTFVSGKYSAAFCTLLGSLSVSFSDVQTLLPLLTSAAAVLVKEQCVLGSTSGVSLALTSSGFQESTNKLGFTPEVRGRVWPLYNLDSLGCLTILCNLSSLLPFATPRPLAQLYRGE